MHKVRLALVWQCAQCFVLCGQITCIVCLEIFCAFVCGCWIYAAHRCTEQANKLFCSHACASKQPDEFRHHTNSGITRIPGLPELGIPVLHYKFEDSGLRRHRTSKTPDFEDTGLRRHRTSKTPDFEDTGLRRHRTLPASHTFMLMLF